jgi:hypothetical protein
VAGSAAINVPTDVFWYRMFNQAPAVGVLTPLVMPLPGTPGGDGITFDLGEIMNAVAL